MDDSAIGVTHMHSVTYTRRHTYTHRVTTLHTTLASIHPSSLAMASEEPLFDPSLKKKKKKKTVAFTEDPLGADADPTTPAPLEDDDAPTAHERMKQSDLEKDNEAKKKKKKEIPMDLVRLIYPLPIFAHPPLTLFTHFRSI